MECRYQDAAVLIPIRLQLAPGGVSHLTIEHDAWCPCLGGDGSQECHPRFLLDGRDITHLADPAEDDPGDPAA